MAYGASGQRPSSNEGEEIYALVNAFRGEQFMTEFNYEIDNVIHDGYNANYLDQNEALMESVGFRGNRFIISSGQDCTRQNEISIYSKKKWNSGLFVISLNHVPQGRQVSGSIIVSGDKNLFGKVEFVTGPSQCGSEDEADSGSKHIASWQDGKLCANSLNKFRGCSTHILVFELMANKKSCNFWIYSISEAPLDLLNENPSPKRWEKKPVVIQFSEDKSENGIRENDKEKFQFISTRNFNNGTVWQITKPGATNEKSNEGFNIGIQLFNDFGSKRIENLYVNENLEDDIFNNNNQCKTADPGAFWELNYVKVYEKKRVEEPDQLSTLKRHENETVEKEEDTKTKNVTKNPFQELLSSLFSYLPSPVPLGINNDAMSIFPNLRAPTFQFDNDPMSLFSNPNTASSLELNNDAAKNFIDKTNKAMSDFQETLNGLIKVNTDNIVSSNNLDLSKLNLNLLNLGEDKENQIKNLFPGFDPLDLESFLSSSDNLMKSPEFKRELMDAVEFISRYTKRRLFENNELVKSKLRRLQDLSMINNVSSTVYENETEQFMPFYSAVPPVVMYPFPRPYLTTYLANRAITEYQDGKKRIASALTNHVKDDFHTVAQNVRDRAADLGFNPPHLVSAIGAAVGRSGNGEVQMQGTGYHIPVAQNMYTPQLKISNVLGKFVADRLNAIDPYRAAMKAPVQWILRDSPQYHY